MGLLDLFESMIHIAAAGLLIFFAYCILGILFAPLIRARNERLFAESEEGKAAQAKTDATNAWLAEKRK